jgi:hypothetical protein
MARQRCEEVVRTCRVAAVDGTTLFTPDGIGHYGALWTRDFAYLVDHGGEFLDAGETRAAIDVLLAGQRADGAVPDRVDRQLVPIFHPGGIGNPLGAGPALDNPMFLVSLVARHHRRHGDDELRQAALPALRRALAWVPRNRGLVFNDAQRPSCTYGFQDTVAKGGHDLFCTLLFVVACRQMADLDPADGAAWRERAAEAEAGLWLLWDDEQGAWLAASEICRQIDVWGNAFAVAHGIGPADSRQRAARWLATHLDDCVHDGQVRHLAAPQTWERLFVDVAPGTYQNGGYWGTAAGWLIEALRTVDGEAADALLADLLAAYRRDGILEWVAPDGGKGPDLYVATIVNTWSLVRDA